MRFQLNRTPVFGILLSICSLNAIADDSASQGYDLGAALGSLLNGYLNGVKQPANTNSNSPATSESSPQQQYNHTAPMNSEDQAYMAKGFWHDPRTGLTWSLCRVGETWNGNSCVGTPTQLDWPHAMLAARDAKLAGYNDWRVPSLSEYAGVLSCPTGFDDTGYGNQYYELVNDTNNLTIKDCRYDQNHQNRLIHKLPDNFNFSTDKTLGLLDEWASSYQYNPSNHIYSPISFTSSRDPSTLFKIRLVRGGSTGGSYQQALQFASNILQLPILRAKNAQAKQDDLARRTTLLRRNVSEGDKTTQGLVIQVKGSLVKLQTYDRVCVGVNQFTNPPICTRYQSVAGREAWVNRNDLTPAQ